MEYEGNDNGRGGDGGMYMWATTPNMRFYGADYANIRDTTPVTSGDVMLATMLVSETT